MTISNLVSVLVIEDEDPVFYLIQDTFIKKPTAHWPLRYKTEQTRTLLEANKLLSKGKYNIVILDLKLLDSEGPKTFYNLKTDLPVIILTGHDNGIYEQILRDGAKRCYDKIFITSCPSILHYAIRHVLATEKMQKLIEQQDQTIKGELRPTIMECAGCRRWRDERTGRWTSLVHYLQQRGFIISHSHCPECEEDFYGKALAEVASDYK